MVQKKATPGTSAAKSPSSSTTKAKTSVVVSQPTAKQLAIEWLNIGNDFDPDVYLKVISDLTGVPPQYIDGDRRFRQYIRPRHLWWACIRTYGKWTYPQIGDYVGKDHTTIMSGIENVPEGVVEGIHSIVQEQRGR